MSKFDEKREVELIIEDIEKAARQDGLFLPAIKCRILVSYLDPLEEKGLACYLDSARRQRDELAEKLALAEERNEGLIIANGRYRRLYFEQTGKLEELEAECKRLNGAEEMNEKLEDRIRVMKDEESRLLRRIHSLKADRDTLRTERDNAVMALAGLKAFLGYE